MSTELRTDLSFLRQQLDGKKYKTFYISAAFFSNSSFRGFPLRYSRKYYDNILYLKILFLSFEFCLVLPSIGLPSY